VDAGKDFDKLAGKLKKKSLKTSRMLKK